MREKLMLVIWREEKEKSKQAHYHFPQLTSAHETECLGSGAQDGSGVEGYVVHLLPDQIGNETKERPDSWNKPKTTWKRDF